MFTFTQQCIYSDVLCYDVILIVDELIILQIRRSGVTESLFWGARGGWQTFVWRGGGGLEDGIAMFVHNRKSNGGGGNGGHGVNGGGGTWLPQAPHIYATDAAIKYD